MIQLPKLYRIGRLLICPVTRGPCPECGRLEMPTLKFRRFLNVVYITVWRTQYSVRLLRKRL